MRLTAAHRQRIRNGVLKSWASGLRRKHRTKKEIEAADPWSKPLVRNRTPRRLRLEHTELDAERKKLVERPGYWRIGSRRGIDMPPVFVPFGESRTER